MAEDPTDEPLDDLPEDLNQWPIDAIADPAIVPVFVAVPQNRLK